MDVKTMPLYARQSRVIFGWSGIVFLLLITSTSLAEIHQWRDKDGNVHFGDRPPAGVSTQTITVKPITYESPKIESLEEALDGEGSVVMYSTTWCPVCRKAKDYFQANKIPFVEYDVENNTKGKRDYERMDGRGVPIILVGKQRLNGFSVAAFHQIYQRQRQ